jgi:hypothetical protein
MVDDEAADAGASRDRGAYLSQAYVNTFGTYDEPDWDPQQGFVANRDRLINPRDFLVRFPTGDVINADDRWAWITEDDGMWAKWTMMPGVAPDERTRLVSLSFSDILGQRFDPVVDALMPPGANDED